MKLSEFYNAILPDEGKLIVARMSDGEKNGKQFRYFKHIVCNDFAQAQKATAAIAKSGADVYYALASYTQGFHQNAKGKTVVRVRDNVHKLKALWFDIDFKSGLSNPTEVVAALREFCNRMRMPAPSILVHSGNGIHVYWPLTTGISLSRWQKIADALKAAAQSHGLAADLVCTADPARVLRPIGTRNHKDPDNPKPVIPIFSSGKLFDPRDLESALLGERASDLGTVPEYVRALEYLPELSQGGHSNHVESFLVNIVRKCGVLSHVLQTNGEDCSEPEWTACLQLAKHCADGELYYHALSEGHPDYTPEDTAAKWQQRLENDAGPTLCDTFAGYRPEICKKCPYRGKIKTPLSLGEEEVTTDDGKLFPLSSYRPIEGDMGMERKTYDPIEKTYSWEKVLTRTWELLDASSDVNTNVYSLTIRTKLGNALPLTISIPGSMLGDQHALKKALGENGCPVRQKEIPEWNSLMTTWLETIQQKRQVGRSVSKLGWIEINETVSDTQTKVELIGFTAGNTSYMADGEVEKNLRIAHQFKEIARHYLPVGDLEVWQDAANFIADQDNPAFTAVLATAFAAPLFQFTSYEGAAFSIVSSQSGLGKTSAMKVAQAVWGSPTRGMNSTSDTYNSVMKKTAFLKNIPVFWDEVRGDKALESFKNAAYDIVQGKERGRLDSSASYQEVNTFKTMVIGASNDSIFDYMGQHSGPTDAGSARVFEVEVEPFIDPTRAARGILFGLLDKNYGHAGAVYSAFISRRQSEISKMVTDVHETLYDEWELLSGERFWCGICATMLVGAQLAAKLGLVKINLKTLKTYMRNRIAVLRDRTGQVMAGSSARELVIAYIQAHQDNMMVVDSFPLKGDNSEPSVPVSPKNKLMIVKQDKSNTYRFLKQDFTKWLRISMHRTFSSLEKELVNQFHMYQMNTVLGARTKWALPKARVIEVSLDDDDG